MGTYEENQLTCYKKYGHTNWVYIKSQSTINNGTGEVVEEVFYYEESCCRECKYLSSECNVCSCRDQYCECNCGYCAGYQDENLRIQTASPEDYIQTIKNIQDGN